MPEVWIALAFFVCLAGCSLGTLYSYSKLPDWHSAAETRDVVRLCAGIFVVMTSLMLGLMVNSAKNIFESADKSLHAYATELILLDRTLRRYGSDAAEARRQLQTYVKQAAARMAQEDVVLSNRSVEQLLDDIGDGVRELRPKDADQEAAKASAHTRFATIFQMRWALIEQSEGTVPMPLIVLLGAWLSLIFASFGYCAPRNGVVVVSFITSSLLIAGAIYLILDMHGPFDGPIQLSSAPLQRALAELER
jgi:hypothetical protein